jgi:hypothetical protein
MNYEHSTPICRSLLALPLSSGEESPLLVGHMGLSHNTLHQHSVAYIPVKSLISHQIHVVTLV